MDPANIVILDNGSGDIKVGTAHDSDPTSVPLASPPCVQYTMRGSCVSAA